MFTLTISLSKVFLSDIFDLASPRLQRLREKVTMYSFNVRWVPGKTYYIADALSRAPLFAPEELPELEIDTAISCLADISSILKYRVRRCGRRLQ